MHKKAVLYLIVSGSFVYYETTSTTPSRNKYIILRIMNWYVKCMSTEKLEISHNIIQMPDEFPSKCISHDNKAYLNTLTDELSFRCHKMHKMPSNAKGFISMCLIGT